MLFLTACSKTDTISQAVKEDSISKETTITQAIQEDKIVYIDATGKHFSNLQSIVIYTDGHEHYRTIHIDALYTRYFPHEFHVVHELILEDGFFKITTLSDIEVSPNNEVLNLILETMYHPFDKVKLIFKEDVEGEIIRKYNGIIG